MIKYPIMVLISLIHCTMFGQNVLVYNDEGVDQTGLQWVVKFFQSRGDHVDIIDADFLIKNDEWIAQYDKIVIPGGADCQYHTKLTGTGCNNIKKFVSNGGTYIGICAGGYFGCKHIEFAKGTVLEICEDRDLGFFPGIARGPMLKPYVYNTIAMKEPVPPRFDQPSIIPYFMLIITVDQHSSSMTSIQKM